MSSSLKNEHLRYSMCTTAQCKFFSLDPMYLKYNLILRSCKIQSDLTLFLAHCTQRHINHNCSICSILNNAIHIQHCTLLLFMILTIRINLNDSHQTQYKNNIQASQTCHIHVRIHIGPLSCKDLSTNACTLWFSLLWCVEMDSSCLECSCSSGKTHKLQHQILNNKECIYYQ